MRQFVAAGVGTIAALIVGGSPSYGQAAATASPTVQVNRASRDTWTPVMDVLESQRTPVTDAQLQRLTELPIEAVWGGLQGKRYEHSFVTGFRQTQPGVKLVGRALTMRYLPVRPDLMEAINTLAKEGDWDFQYNVRAGEDAKPGDVIVVELGGMVNRATFMGDVTGLGMKMAGVKGVIIDGGLRDLSEFLPWKDFPVHYTGSHASAMADQVGVEWNAPIRLGRDDGAARRRDHRRCLGRAGVSAATHRRADCLGRDHGLHGELQARDDAQPEVPVTRHLPDVEPGAREGLREVARKCTRRKG